MLQILNQKSQPNQLKSPSEGKSPHDRDPSDPNWPDAKPLIREMPPAVEFDFGCLGSILGPACMATYETVQAPKALIANSYLAAAALASQPFHNILLDGRTRPIGNYFITFAQSGERKSTVDTWALNPLREHERKNYENWDTQIVKFAHEKEVHEKTLGALSIQYDQALTNEDEINSDRLATLLSNKREIEPKAPLQPHLICEDPTGAGLIRQFHRGSSSLGLFCDEGGRVTGGWGMSKENIITTCGILNQCWDGAPISSTRVENNVPKLFGRRLSAHLMIQPDIGLSWYQNDVTQGSGLSARLLATYPQSTIGSRSYSNLILSEDERYKSYVSDLNRLLSYSPRRRGTQSPELDPNILKLSNKSQVVYESFYNYIESEMKRNCRLAEISGLASKAPEHACRIASVLHTLEQFDRNELSPQYLEFGIELMNYYLDEALRLRSVQAETSDLSKAGKLLQWLDRRRSALITLVELYQKGPDFVRTASSARHYLSILVEHGWVRQVNCPTEYDGVMRKDVFQMRSSL